MTIWAILILTSAMATVGLATAQANEQLYRDLRVERRARMGVGLAVLFMLAAIATATLWTIYAFQVGDWRFAAIQWIPVVMAWIGKAAVNAKPKATAR